MDMTRFFILVSLLLSFNWCRAQQQPISVVTRTVNATDRAAFNYSGEWRRGGGTCEGGMLTSTPGASVSFRFTGADLSFVIHGVAESQREALSVTVDGLPVAVPTLTAETTPNCGRESVRVRLPSGAALEPSVEHTLNITLREPVATTRVNNVVLFSASFSAPSVADAQSTSSSLASTASSSSLSSATSTPEPVTALDIAPSSAISFQGANQSSESTPGPMSTSINARSDSNQASLSAGAVVGIVVGAIAVLAIGISALLCTRRYDRRHEAPNLLSNQDLERIADRAVNAAFPTEPTAAEPIKGLADGAIHVVLPFTYAGNGSDLSLDKKDQSKFVIAPPAQDPPSRRSMFGFGRKAHEARGQQQRQSHHESFLPLYSPLKLTKASPSSSSSSPTISTPTKPSSSPPTNTPLRRPSGPHFLPRLSVSLSADTGYSPARDHPDGVGLTIAPARRPSYAKDMHPAQVRRPSTANSRQSGASSSTFGGLGATTASSKLEVPSSEGLLNAEASTGATITPETTLKTTPGSPTTPRAPLEQQEFPETAEPLFYQKP